MGAPLWQLQGHVARLHLGPLRATIDLSRPADGLTEVCLDSRPLAGARLLAVVTAAAAAGDAGTLIDRYVRSTELVAAYEESAAGPVRVDALWRGAAPTAAGPPVAALDLVVSVRTQRFDSRPELVVQSILPAAEALWLQDATSCEFQSLAPQGDVPLVLEPQRGPGCLLLRLPGGQRSYAEMVHPADFQHDELRGTLACAGLVRVDHRLFARELEKGVILRARVRGVLLARRHDQRMAAEWYTALAAEEAV